MLTMDTRTANRSLDSLVTFRSSHRTKQSYLTHTEFECKRKISKMILYLENSVARCVVMFFFAQTSLLTLLLVQWRTIIISLLSRLCSTCADDGLFPLLSLPFLFSPVFNIQSQKYRQWRREAGKRDCGTQTMTVKNRCVQRKKYRKRNPIFLFAQRFLSGSTEIVGIKAGFPD